MGLEPGQVIEGKYRVVRRIGEGGMGTVYEGQNTRIERRVAIKVLHAHVASSPEFAQRFEREARASARIGSDHVCDVIDLGDLPNGDRFMVMEFLDGVSLEERLTDRIRMGAHELAPIAFEILEGLGGMHNAGVVHRDLKPANIFLTKASGRRAEMVKILDFGVAKILPRADEPGQMTSTGMMMGTPLYMSPEQARGARDVDGRTDLYAASVIFYRALAGRLPFIAENLHDLLFKIVLEDPKHLRELVEDVDGVFADIVMKGLARDPDKRYPSARAFQEKIVEWAEKTGRTSLKLQVTLPTEPPPLIRISLPEITRESLAESLATSNTITMPSSPEKQQSGGTPIAWSEPKPVAPTAAEIASTSVSAGISPAIAAPVTAPPVPAEEPKRSRLPYVLGAGAFALILAAAVALKVTGKVPTDGKPDTKVEATSAPPAITSAIAPPPGDPTHAPSATASPSVEPSSSASAPPAVLPPPVTPVGVRRPTQPTAATATSSSTPPAPSTAPVAATAPTPATSGSAKRKFRTNLD